MAEEFPTTTVSAVSQTTPLRQLPFREDCWSEEATSTLVDAWGRRYLELNRGNLRQKDWQEVAGTVNSVHGHAVKSRRTDVQCKNRIDTLKKKYKVEKAKVVESNGTLTSSWQFFSRLDALVGCNYNKQQQIQPFKLTPVVSSSPSQPLHFAANSSPPMAVPLPYRMTLPPLPAAKVQPQPLSVVLPQKRPFPGMDNSYFRRNYSAVAAAAAGAAAKPVVGEEEMESEEVASEDEDQEDGVRKLAKAIERFGEIFERVEGMKQRQMVELEKQRMQFAKDLEVQRMHLFMDTQVYLEKLKHAKRTGLNDLYS